VFPVKNAPANPLPDYAVQLLYAANSTLGQETLSDAGRKLLIDAVIAFELQMPMTVEGFIFTETIAQKFLLNNGE
jgi:hypothetical protein